MKQTVYKMFWTNYSCRSCEITVLNSYVVWDHVDEKIKLQNRFVHEWIGHFRVAVNLIMKARLSAVFIMKISFHSYANKTNFHMKSLCTYPRFDNEVHSNSEMGH